MPIETGRWNNIDLPDRKCQLCDKNDLGDEYLLICPFFKHERRTYIDLHFRNAPNILKYKEILQIADTDKLVRLGKYMRIIMQKCQTCKPETVSFTRFIFSPVRSCHRCISFRQQWQMSGKGIYHKCMLASFVFS